MTQPRFRYSLMLRLIIAIIVGILAGRFAPVFVNRAIVTLSGLFGSFLLFVIPLMILAFVTAGIADLSGGAGKLLAFSAVLAYTSTVVTGVLSFLVASRIFPRFIDPERFASVGSADKPALEPYFTFPMPPLFSVTSAIVLAFILGVCISGEKTAGGTRVLSDFFHELSRAITKVLRVIIIPLLPVFICGSFINMTVSGEAHLILGVLWKVFLTVIALHMLYLLAVFAASAALTRRSPLTMMKNQIPGWLSAFGTQSSAATIPVNLECAMANGVSSEIRHFVIPLFANSTCPAP